MEMGMGREGGGAANVMQQKRRETGGHGAEAEQGEGSKEEDREMEDQGTQVPRRCRCRCRSTRPAEAPPSTPGQRAVTAPDKAKGATTREGEKDEEGTQRKRGETTDAFMLTENRSPVFELLRLPSFLLRARCKRSDRCHETTGLMEKVVRRGITGSECSLTPTVVGVRSYTVHARYMS
ncbi:hypothetical protein GW17_00042674 [Ensete ventricosum]|nr:hypothetical protein GW17_00042674 [Ensete ventricosum]